MRCCNSALSLSFLLRIFSGAAKAPWRPAPEKIRSKNERLSAQTLTRRYEMVRNTVTDRAPRAFKEQALGPRRAERASPEKADHSAHANQLPSPAIERIRSKNERQCTHFSRSAAKGLCVSSLLSAFGDASSNIWRAIATIQ